jgi:hypothetical protein
VRSKGDGNFATVDTLAGPRPPSAIGVGATPSRSSSTAWRNDTPSTRITQSITDPPTWHAPKQCHKFFAGLITSDGDRSS